MADIFTPGSYTLDTENLPILSTLMGWKYGFHSPFKAEVYFVSTRRFTDLKWGTKHQITLRDPEFGPIRLRAFGTYEIRVTDPAAFIRQIVGTDGQFTTEEITDQLRNLIVSRFADLIGESKIPILDLAANYDELGAFITKRIHDDFGSYGLEVCKMLVENISLPEEVEKTLDKRTSMGVIGNLSQYTQFQSANALEDAAKNPGGLAAGGMGMGMGFAMGNQMAQSMHNGQPSSPNTPPPLPQTKLYFIAVNNQQTGPLDMETLKSHAQSGQLTPETLVWKTGMPQWRPAGQVVELASLFGSAPPPLPDTSPRN